MSDAGARAEELYDKACGLPNSATKVALLEEAVQLADSISDVDMGFRMRDELMSAADFSGRPDIMLVHFAWCLAQYDRDPASFDLFGLLWKYKWVTECSVKFPQISRAKLE